MRWFSILALTLVASPALASTYSGTPTKVQINNSSNSYACAIVIGSVTFYVDDASGNFGATCLGAMSALENGQSITVSYYSSSGYYWAYGIYSAKTSSTVDYIYTNDYTGTSSADQCKAYVNGSTSTWYYVDDGNPEEDITCGMMFMLQFNGKSWTLGYSGSEVTYLQMY